MIEPRTPLVRVAFPLIMLGNNKRDHIVSSRAKDLLEFGKRSWSRGNLSSPSYVSRDRVHVCKMRRTDDLCQRDDRSDSWLASSTECKNSSCILDNETTRKAQPQSRSRHVSGIFKVSNLAARETDSWFIAWLSRAPGARCALIYVVDIRGRLRRGEKGEGRTGSRRGRMRGDLACVSYVVRMYIHKRGLRDSTYRPRIWHRFSHDACGTSSPSQPGPSATSYTHPSLARNPSLFAGSASATHNYLSAQQPYLLSAVQLSGPEVAS